VSGKGGPRGPTDGGCRSTWRGGRTGDHTRKQSLFGRRGSRPKGTTGGPLVGAGRLGEDVKKALGGQKATKKGFSSLEKKTKGGEKGKRKTKRDHLGRKPCRT